MGRTDDRRFIVISGLPGSGKSFLAQRLSPLLELPVIDKDDILDRLFHAKGSGDAEWRRAWSRESDLEFRRAAEAAPEGAILVSFWHLPGMPEDSGTPTDWLARLSGRLFYLECKCAVELAASRFVRRRRHPGHLDAGKSYEQVLASLQVLRDLGPLNSESRVVDTSSDINLVQLVNEITGK